jgi:hypothetical protein
VTATKKQRVVAAGGGMMSEGAKPRLFSCHLLQHLMLPRALQFDARDELCEL